MPEKRILVVEDDRDFLRALAVRLKASGYRVLSASDAVMAVITARKEEPDLILLDLGLPGGGGFTVLERLTRMLHFDVPIIVLTSQDPWETRERALHAGAAAFFRKPPDNARLLATIRRLLHEEAEIGAQNRSQVAVATVLQHRGAA